MAVVLLMISGLFGALAACLGGFIFDLGFFATLAVMLGVGNGVGLVMIALMLALPHRVETHRADGFRDKTLSA